MAPGDNARVLDEGRELPDADVQTVPARQGRPLTLVKTRLGDRPEGATITVVGPEGGTYEGRKPPDEVLVSASTSIRRDERFTTITVTPAVKTEGPDGKTTERRPEELPEGTETRAQFKDDDGAWRDIFNALNMTFTTAVTAGATYLMVSDQAGSRGGAVQTAPDGSTTVTVPNEVYNASLQDNHTTHEQLASQAGAGLQQPARGEGDGITVTSVSAVGTSPRSLRPGDTVIFHVRVDKELAGAFTLGGVLVDLAAGEFPCGPMSVQDAVADPATGEGTLTAVLPAGTVSHTGELTARIHVENKISNPVTLGLAPDVSLEVSHHLTIEGSTVTVTLLSQNGGPIRGTLIVEGSGTLLGGEGNRMHFDTWSTATAVVLAENPGDIQVRFVPDEDASAGMADLFEER